MSENELRRCTLEFYECEHEGDMEMYTNDLEASGFSTGRIEINHEAETGSVEISAPKDQWKECLEKFKLTDAYGYLN